MAAAIDAQLEQRAPNELRALAALAFEELQAFPGAIARMHLGIAARAFGGSGPAARPIQLVHDAVAGRAYGTVSAGMRLAGVGAEAAIAPYGARRGAVLSGAGAGSAALGALNGLIGDRLERSGSELQQPASVRVDGRAVALDARSLGAAFPRAGERVVVFLHGLMCTERNWQWQAARHGGSYGARLAADLGFTPVYVRYNSGRHISENGRSLAELLSALLDAWPCELRALALVGHSMGGLVARSACHYGRQDGAQWTRRVSHVVSLGTPHLGAPLEQGAHYAAAALSALPETAMLGSLLRRRSAGIRDLRHGSLVDEDWRGRDPEALRAAAVAEVPLLAGATHCFVSAAVASSPDSLPARLLGDTLVLVPSASGRGRTRRIPFDPEHGHHVATHHLALLNHAAVYERLRDWLAEQR